MRVEVLVPAAKRDVILAEAKRIREDHRERKHRVGELCSKAVEHYAARLFDNVDLSRISDSSKRASIIAKSLIERGDARAFTLGRKILSELEG